MKINQETNGAPDKPGTLPIVLAIGGLDPSGGAGLPADTRAIAAFGAHCCSVATAVIAQNTQGVQQFEPVAPSLLAAQLDNLLADIKPHAVKIGMLPNSAAVEVVAARLAAFNAERAPGAGREPAVPIVLDTVFAPSRGPVFSSASTIAAMRERLLPLCEWITPNIPEAAQLLNRDLNDASLLATAVRNLHRNFNVPFVLLKGGHWPERDGNGQEKTRGEAIDFYFNGAQQHLEELRAPRIIGYEVRGTGCLLASAIAAQRAQNVECLTAAKRAKRWLHEKIRTAQPLGSGRRIAV